MKKIFRNSIFLLLALIFCSALTGCFSAYLNDAFNVEFKTLPAVQVTLQESKDSGCIFWEHNSNIEEYNVYYSEYFDGPYNLVTSTDGIVKENGLKYKYYFHKSGYYKVEAINSYSKSLSNYIYIH